MVWRADPPQDPQIVYFCVLYVEHAFYLTLDLEGQTSCPGPVQLLDHLPPGYSTLSWAWTPRRIPNGCCAYAQRQAAHGECLQGNERRVFWWERGEGEERSLKTCTTQTTVLQVRPRKRVKAQRLVVHVGPFREQPRPATSPLADCRTNMVKHCAARAGPATAR